MRVSTFMILVLFVVSAGLLVWSVSQAGQADYIDGRRIYRFAAWGAAEEMRQLRSEVIDPINAASETFRIEVIAIPGDYNTKLLTMVAGGTGPDFFYLSQEFIPLWSRQGALMDLTDMVERDESPVCDLSDYYQAVLDQYRRDGRLYALPWIAMPVVMYCNVDLFADAGVPLPDDSWDWQRFIQAGQQLTRDTDGNGQIDTWGFLLHQWPPIQIWIWQAGGQLIDRRTGQVQLSDPAVLRGAQFKADLINRYRVAPPLSRIDSGVHKPFQAGNAAMFFGGAADDHDRIEGLNVVVRPLPKGPAGPATFAWSAGLCISPHVDDPEQAFEVYKLLLEGIQRWKIPAPRRTLAAEIEQIEPRKAAAAEAIRTAMEHMQPPRGLIHAARFSDLLWREFEEPLLRGHASAEQLARPAEQRLQEIAP
ncbi:MAG: ABC transporter substrate-binding protein [Phycisphaerae bacterium]